MSKAKYNQETRDFYTELIKDKPIEKKIKMLEIAERQKYNYYCSRTNNGWNWTPEEDARYQSEWNEILEMINELKAELQNSKTKEDTDMTIKTSKYNEVAPSEIKRILEAGGRIIKGETRIGTFITNINGMIITADDSIEINNVRLPLAIAKPEYFDREITING